MHSPFVPTRWARERVRLVLCLAAIVAAIPAGTVLAQNGGAQKPNYELAAAWTAQKVGRLVFDTSVRPVGSASSTWSIRCARRKSLCSTTPGWRPC